MFKRKMVSVMLLGAMAAIAAPAKVFILAGQSNMCGVGWTPDLTEFDGPSNVMIFKTVNSFEVTQQDWVPLTKENGTVSANNFGPELGFSKLISMSFPGESIYIIKACYAGQNLAYAWNPNNAIYQKTLLKTYQDAMQRLENRGVSGKLAGFIWMQGESDAENEVTARAYKENLVNFSRCIRRDLNSPDLPFIYGKIANNINPGSQKVIWKYGSIVQQAQEEAQAEIPNSVFVEKTALEPVWPWDEESATQHYNTQGTLGVGRDFGEAWIAFDKARRARMLPAVFNTLMLD